jgi:hypothetical protein
VIGCVSMLSVCIILYRSSSLTGINAREGAWKQYTRPLLFILGFLLIYAFALYNKLNDYLYDDGYVVSATDYILCLLGPNGSTATCGEHPRDRPSMLLWRGVHIALAGQGVITFAIYGSQWDNYILWSRTLTQGYAQLSPRVGLGGGGGGTDARTKPHGTLVQSLEIGVATHESASHPTEMLVPRMGVKKYSGAETQVIVATRAAAPELPKFGGVTSLPSPANGVHADAPVMPGEVPIDVRTPAQEEEAPLLNEAWLSSTSPLRSNEASK